MTAHGNNPATRRADIDYLRVGALLLLIVYHVMLIFDSTEWWRARSNNAGLWADYIVNSLTSWRMALVFFVGGIAARFMLDAKSTEGFVRDRAAKLVTAFVFAVVVLVPPLAYVRLDDNGAPAQSYFDYLVHQAPAATSFHGVPMPEFAHAWFLPYLLLYSVAAALAWRAWPRAVQSLEGAVERLPLWSMVAALMFWLTLIEAVLAPWRPESRLIFPDITAHLHYAPLFAFGLIVAKSGNFRAKLLAHRHGLWAAAGLFLLASLAARANVIAGAEAGTFATLASLAARGFFGATMMFAASAFAAKFLVKPTPVLAYATDAILPVYLMHQTALIIAADTVLKLHWPLAMELFALFAAALLAPLAAYHFLVRPNTWLRVLFGLRPNARRAHTPAASPQAIAP